MRKLHSKFAFCEKIACENSHFAKFAFRENSHAKNRIVRKIRMRKFAFCEKSHYAKIRKISHRFAKFF